MNLQEEHLMYQFARHFVEDKHFHMLLMNENRGEIWLEKRIGKKSIIIRLLHEGFDWKNYLKTDIAQVFQRVKSLQQYLSSKHIEIYNVYISSYEPVDSWEILKKPMQLKEKNPAKMKVYYLTNDTVTDEIHRLYDDLQMAAPSFGIDEKGQTKEAQEQFIQQTKKYLIDTYEERRKRVERVFSYGKPFFTYLLIVSNIIMYFLLEINGGSTDLENLVSLGAKYNPAILDGQWWRIVSSMFLHIGIFHLLMNMFALYYIGLAVERIYGSWRFLVIYMLAGIGGGVASFAFTINIAAGASGAIFGLFGALLFFGINHRHTFFQTMGKGIIMVIVINVAIGFLVPQIDNAAHLGGLIGGFLASAIVHLPKQRKRMIQLLGLALYTVILFITVNFGINENLSSSMFQLTKIEEMIQNGSYELAIEEATNEIEADSEYKAELLFQRSYAYIELNNLELAKQDLKESITLKDDLPESYYNLALIYVELGEEAAAKEAISQAYELAPTETDIREQYENITGSKPK